MVGLSFCARIELAQASATRQAKSRAMLLGLLYAMTAGGDRAERKEMAGDGDGRRRSKCLTEKQGATSGATGVAGKAVGVSLCRREGLTRPDS